MGRKTPPKKQLTKLAAAQKKAIGGAKTAAVPLRDVMEGGNIHPEIAIGIRQTTLLLKRRRRKENEELAKERWRSRPGTLTSEVRKRLKKWGWKEDPKQEYKCTHEAGMTLEMPEGEEEYDAEEEEVGSQERRARAQYP